jgi:hypothetical protein
MEVRFTLQSLYFQVKSCQHQPEVGELLSRFRDVANRKDIVPAGTRTPVIQPIALLTEIRNNTGLHHIWYIRFITVLSWIADWPTLTMSESKVEWPQRCNFHGCVSLFCVVVAYGGGVVKGGGGVHEHAALVPVDEGTASVEMLRCNQN